MTAWARDTDQGVLLRVHVRPGATRSGLAGTHGDALAVRLRARPVEGAANRELVRVVAAALGVRPADVEIARGEHGRDKQVLVRGLTADAVRARVAAGSR